MRARNLGPASQKVHVRSRERFAAWLGRSPDTSTPDEVKRFQQYLVESGVSIVMRNRIMTGVKFLLQVTLRRHDLVSEVFHLREPQRVPLVLSRQEIKRLLAMAPDLRARAMLSLAYGCGPARWCGCGSATSTAPRASSASSSRRAARTAT